MVAAILSAQCTDKRVNSVLPELFSKYPDAVALALADQADLEEIIRSCGLHRTKARNLIKTSQILNDKYSGELPKSIEALSKLPGIGRKTANVIIAHVFDGPGFAVDTHVNRVLNRIGIVKTNVPEKIEKVIRNLIEPKYLGNFSLLLITHGRNCCKARKPNCCLCVINQLCYKLF
jgi:endonuclease-3